MAIILNTHIFGLLALPKWDDRDKSVGQEIFNFLNGKLKYIPVIFPRFYSLDKLSMFFAFGGTPRIKIDMIKANQSNGVFSFTNASVDWEYR